MLKIAYSPSYCHPLPTGHRFPMEKYELLPLQLRHEGTAVDDNFFSPRPADEASILRAHKPDYWNKLNTLSLSKSEIRATGFPLSQNLVDREVLIAGGSIEAAEFALQHGIAMNIAGGTHHAYSDRGEGFCLLNDLAITARWLQDHQLAAQVLIIDLDVHQGNGTAEIFREDPTVFTLSLHGAKNYPHRKEMSDLDVPLEDGITDEAYLKQLQNALDQVFNQFEPDFILYQSGVDVLATDKLGRLGLSLAGVHQRDRMVLNLAKELDVPIQCSMGGGYSQKISQIIEAHAQVYRLAQDLYF